MCWRTWIFTDTERAKLRYCYNSVLDASHNLTISHAEDIIIVTLPSGQSVADIIREDGWNWAKDRGNPLDTVGVRVYSVGVTVGTAVEGGHMGRGEYFVVATVYQSGRPDAIFAARRPDGPYYGESIVAGPFETLAEAKVAEDRAWDELVFTDSDGYAQWR